MNNPLRFYDKNGNGCFVSTNDCSFHGNSTKAINREKQIEQTKTDYEEALQKLLTVKISATNDQYVPIPWHDSITSSAPQTLQADMKNRFDIRSEEQRCRLAIECRVAQLAIDKGVKCSRDGTLYCEFLAQVQSQPKVWEAVKHTHKRLTPRCI